MPDFPPSESESEEDEPVEQNVEVKCAQGIQNMCHKGENVEKKLEEKEEESLSTKIENT